MKTITISPLGAIAIGFYVHQWNQSKVVEKARVRQYLENKETAAACSLIRWIADNHFYECFFERKIDELLVKSSRVLVLNRDHDFSSTEDLCKKADDEVLTYFAEMFKQGFFEQIPMPEFSYALPPENLASFQKFCAEQALKLPAEEIEADKITRETVLPSTVPRFKKS